MFGTGPSARKTLSLIDSYTIWIPFTSCPGLKFVYYLKISYNMLKLNLTVFLISLTKLNKKIGNKFSYINNMTIRQLF